MAFTKFTPKHQGQTWFPKIFGVSPLPCHTQLVLKQRLSNLQRTSGQSSSLHMLVFLLVTSKSKHWSFSYRKEKCKAGLPRIWD